MQVNMQRDNEGNVSDISVKIDGFDTWSMDWTLSHIIHPMLVQLKTTKHGHPEIDQSDVPVDFYDTYDENGFSREAWGWVLDEMIWSMNEIKNDKSGPLDKWIDENVPTEGNYMQNLRDNPVPAKIYVEEETYNNRIQNGCKLFGKYFQDLWD